MFCKKCGMKLDDDALFCEGCGAKTPKTVHEREIKVACIGNSSASAATIQIKCKACNGMMEMDADSNVLECPYCGSKEVIVDSEVVAAQKIKSQTEKEIEFKKMEEEEKRIKSEEEKEMRDHFKKGKFSKFLIICAIISFLMCYMQFSDRATLSGIIALIQGSLYTVAWLMGMQIVKSKKKYMYILLVVIGFVLIIPFMGATQMKEAKKYTWGNGGYYDVIPKPETDYGTLYDNDETFTLHAEKVSSDDYYSYVDECKDRGFTIEANEKGDEYIAFNKDGYKLKLNYAMTNEKMDIRLEKPIKRNEIVWPSSGLASKLPITKSKVGDVRIDNERQYRVYVCDTSVDEFSNYINACKTKGFVVDYRTGDNYYYADNENGDSLSLNYEGNNTMCINIYAADEKEDLSGNDNQPDAGVQEGNKPQITKVPETTKQPQKTKAPDPVKTEKPKDNLVNGMRPEFKKAMDEYEKFFDEYCEFMEKVSNNPEDLTLMLQYGDFMTQYTETMEALEDMENDDLNDAEMKYYLETMDRINKKLLSVAM